MERRTFLGVVAGSLLAAPFAAEVDEGGHVLVEYRFARAKPNRLFEQSAGDLIQGTR
jgi:hypothetical protein